MIAEHSTVPRVKSRIAVTSVTDNFSIGNNGRSFATMYLDPEPNNYFNIRWRKEFPCRYKEAVTSIAEDLSGNIYISGYTKNDNLFNSTGFDFATIKYRPNGNYDWYIPNFIPNTTPIGRVMNKWSEIHLANDGSPLIVVQCWDEEDAYWSAIRYDLEGNILYTINDENTEGDNFSRPSNEPEINSPENIKLENYPNPFNPKTIINYELRITNNVSLRVYDVLGIEVTTLVNEKQNPGSHSVIFDGSNLSSGVYYYTLSLDGNNFITKRMLLVK